MADCWENNGLMRLNSSAETRTKAGLPPWKTEQRWSGWFVFLKPILQGVVDAGLPAFAGGLKGGDDVR